MPKRSGPPRNNSIWSAYLEIALIWNLKEKSPVTPAMLDAAWPSFWQWHRQYPRKETLADDFTSGADAYKGFGSRLPSWQVMFVAKRGHPVMNVLRHAERKEAAPSVTVDRPSEDRRSQIRKKYEEE